MLTRRITRSSISLEPEIAEAFPQSMKINDWEMRWFIRTLADRDVEKLSPVVRARMAGGGGNNAY